MIQLYIILFALVIYFIFSAAQFYNVLFRGYAPFVPTDREIIRKIMSEIQVREQATIYELGCGRAGFLRLMESVFPKTKLIGVENLFTLYLVSQIELKLKGSKIRLLKKNFFAVDLKEADLIFCYLNNTTMASLGEKFRRECRPGTQIISRSFPIPQFTPEKVIEIKDKKVYFYRV